LGVTCAGPPVIIHRHHPRMRLIQYSRSPAVNRDAAAYWIPPLSASVGYDGQQPNGALVAVRGHDVLCIGYHLANYQGKPNSAIG
jgi:hypothetical protein